MSMVTLSAPFTTVDETTTNLKKQLFNTFQSAVPRLVLFFATSNADSAGIALKMQEIYPNTPTFGCTTAGELISGQMLKNSVVVCAFDSETVEDVQVEIVHNIKEGNNVQQAYQSFANHFGDLKEVDLKNMLG